MSFLQDKKNLPFIIIGVVVLLGIAVGAFMFMSKGSGGADGSEGVAPTAAAPATSAPTATAPSPTPGATPAPTSAAPAAAGGPMAAAPGSAPAPGAVSVPGQPGAAPAGQAPGDATKVAATPIEPWKSDPFAPDVGKGHKAVVKQKMYIPSMPLLFPPRAKQGKDLPVFIRPQPPMRVAGILFSDRVSALIQTLDGWYTVKPGDRMRNGCVVVRIERDRVVLRTPEDQPRLIEIRLAASALPLEQPAQNQNQNQPGSNQGSGQNRMGASRGAQTQPM